MRNVIDGLGAMFRQLWERSLGRLSRWSWRFRKLLQRQAPPSKDFALSPPPRNLSAVLDLNPEVPHDSVPFPFPGPGEAWMQGYVGLHSPSQWNSPGIDIWINGVRQGRFGDWVPDDSPEVSGAVSFRVRAVLEHDFIELAQQRFRQYIRTRIQYWVLSELNGDSYRRSIQPLIPRSERTLHYFLGSQSRLAVASRLHLFPSNRGLIKSEELGAGGLDQSIKFTQNLHTDHFVLSGSEETILDFRSEHHETLLRLFQSERSFERVDQLSKLLPRGRRPECPRGKDLKDWFLMGLARSPELNEVKVEVCPESSFFQTFPAALIPSDGESIEAAEERSWRWIQHATLLINCDSELARIILKLDSASDAVNHVPAAVHTLAAWYSLRPCSPEFHHSQWWETRALVGHFRTAEREVANLERKLSRSTKLERQVGKLNSDLEAKKAELADIQEKLETTRKERDLAVTLFDPGRAAAGGLA